MPNCSAKYESSLALAMITQVLKNADVKSVLAGIADKLRDNVLHPLIEQERHGQSPNLQSLAMQHSAGDRFVGALLPDHDQAFLESTAEGRKLLLNAIDVCLQDANKINNPHAFLALMKAIDGMAFMHDVRQTFLKNPAHLTCKEYLAPTPEETNIRSKRTDGSLAVTYGIGTDEIDLVKNAPPSKACYSGKARFFIKASNETRPPVWFEQLTLGLPLIASPSNATAKNFIMADGLGLFTSKDKFFEFDKAHIFANCFMAYLVYSGHHSICEVAEMWNRFLDFIAIEKPDQLPKGIILKSLSSLPYIKDPEAVELKMPYAKVGDYSSFLHPWYAKTVIESAEMQMTEMDLRFDAQVFS